MPDDIHEVLRNMGDSPISNLYAKMERAIRNQQGTRFSASDLDWLTVIGAYAAVLQAVADNAFVDSAARLTAQGHDVSHFPRRAVQTFKGEPDADAVVADADLKASPLRPAKGKPRTRAKR